MNPLPRIPSPRNPAPLTIADLGEQGLLQRLQPFCAPGVVGDDGAVLQPSPGQALVVTTDTLVEGVHFSATTTPPEAVGWRSAAANLSDLAAMGALPLGLTVALALPSTCSVAWLEGLYQGLAQCVGDYGTAIVGGDLCRAPHLVVSITALGEVPPPLVLKRNAAQVGDAIVVTGYHGASRAGLELLLDPDRALTGLCPPSPQQRDQWIRAHQYPRPRLDWVPWLRSALAQGQSASASRSFAAMDSSDGLADAVLQLCRASGVGAHLVQADLPLPLGLASWQGLATALDWTLYGGEDFELVLCLPETVLAGLEAASGAGVPAFGLRRVGTIVAGSQVTLHGSDPQEPGRVLSLDRGFQHFSDPSPTPA